MSQSGRKRRLTSAPFPPATSTNKSPSPQKSKKKKPEQEPKQDFSAPWHFSDVVLVVEERKFHVHRSTLSMWSTVFETMFTSEFKEKTAPEIPLPIKNSSEIEALLRLIYSRKEQVTEQNFEVLLKLADEYEMKEVTDLCLTYMTSILKHETSLHLYAIAAKYNLPDFVKKCLDKIKFLQFDFLSTSKHFLELEQKDQLHIMSCKAQAAEKALRNSKDKMYNDIMEEHNTIASCDKCQSDVCNNSKLFYSKSENTVYDCSSSEDEFENRLIQAISLSLRNCK